MKIKATIVFLLLSVLLIGKSDKVVARLHSNVQLVQHATAVDNTFSICEKSALKYAEVNVCNWQVTADVFPDYYPSDEEDDSIDNSVVFINKFPYWYIIPILDDTIDHSL